MRRYLLPVCAALAVAGACSKTENGDVVIKRPDISVKTTEDTLHRADMPSIGTRTDTVNSPVVGTQKDTIVVNKPVVGTEKKVVKVPDVKRP
jgi:hypothetical protein